MDHILEQKYNEWILWDKNNETRKYIESLKTSEKIDELKKLLLTRMEFGTAGLRTRMGAGNSQMNDLTIIQTAQGLLRYCESCFPKIKEMGIVIGFDGRYNSHKWAQMTANIFQRAGCRVFLYSDLTPTPFVPFGVVHYKTACGVMVTASHNPKEDNGYKVYWANSAQIIPPHDSGIAQSIENNLLPWKGSWDFEGIDSRDKCTDPLQEISDNYYPKQKALLCHNYANNAKSPLKFTYTAMHGVGYTYVKKMFEVFGFQNMIPVLKQVHPDPEFPTVRFPNPEEGKSALNLAMETADTNCSPVILANDPDADRLAVAEKQPDGKWKIFTGNELGALIGWWCWKNFQKSNPDVKASDAVTLASTVSSKVLRSIGKKEGFQFEETLTGFKWMGNVAHQLMGQGKRIVFAFEEAIGYMCGHEVLDKDGVGAIGVMGELAIQVYGEGFTLQGQLEKIYTEYGYHTSNNSYYFCYKKTVIDTMFHRLRNWKGGESCDCYPETCGPYKITAVRDLSTGYDSGYPDKKARLPVSSSSEMVTFNFENGCVATIRTSGTEPKIKYYSEYCATPLETRPWTDLDKELEDLVSHIVSEFYQPEKNGLTPRSD